MDGMEGGEGGGEGGSKEVSSSSLCSNLNYMS